MLKPIKVIVAAVLALFSLNASAYLLEDVGPVLDTLIGSTTLASSGEAVEEAWVEGLLGIDIDYAQIDIGGEDGDLWQFVTDDGIDGTVAFDFSPYNPEYFVVKVGDGSGTGTTDSHFLYDNLESLMYAYINLSDFGEGVNLLNIGVISHAGSVGDVIVPEPGVIGLLAIGLLGMGVARRRTKA